MISRTVSFVCLSADSEALTREVAAKEQFLRRQKILRGRRRSYSKLRWVDICYLVADRSIGVDAICSPTSQRCAEWCYGSARGAMI
jgi:hypothetical protein